MWNCDNCGCLAIIVERCPVCGTEKPMAKTTVEGGYSDRNAPVEVVPDEVPLEDVDNAEPGVEAEQEPEPEQPEEPAADQSKAKKGK